MTKKTTREVFAKTLRYLWGEDRTGIPREVMRWPGKVAAWLAIVLVYVIGWAPSTLFAFTTIGVQVPARTYTTDSVPHQLEQMNPTVVAIACALVLIWQFRKNGHVRPVRPGFSLSVRTFFVGYAIIAGGFISSFYLTRLTGWSAASYVEQTFTADLPRTLSVIEAGLAGPAEELALLLLVVTVLRVAGYSWPVVIIAAVAVRIPFHMYYGWGAIGMAIWPVLMVVLYRRTGAILAIILTHASWNMLNYAGGAGDIFKQLAVVGGIGIFAFHLFRHVGVFGRKGPEGAPATQRRLLVDGLVYRGYSDQVHSAASRKAPIEKYPIRDRGWGSGS